MNFDASWESRFCTLVIVGSFLVVAGCSSSDDGGGSGTGTGSSVDGGSGAGSSADGGGGGGGGGASSGQTTFSCGKAGEFCIEYYGTEAGIDAIRKATNCAGQGAVEGTGCVKEGAVVCTLPKNGGTGSSGAQYYYGEQSEDDLTSLKATCERSGGTFSAP